MNLETLTRQAADALLAQTPVVVTHPAGWQRDGFPLPIKREPPAPDGSVTQGYRPLAVFEYVNEKLTVKKAPKPADDTDLFGSSPDEPNLFA